MPKPKYHATLNVAEASWHLDLVEPNVGFIDHYASLSDLVSALSDMSTDPMWILEIMPPICDHAS